jgi:hypothetical protein
MNLVFRFLRTPCMYCSSFGKTLKHALIAGGVVAAVLVLYQPFGISNIQANYKLLKIAGFGLPCILPVLLMGYIRKLLLDFYELRDRWCIGYEILIWIPMLLLIGIFNLAYLWLLGDRFSASFALRMEFHTFLIGMIPCAILLLKEQGFSVSLQQMMETQTEEDPTPSDKPSLYKLTTERESQEINPENICLIKAEGNYVEVTHCDIKGTTNSELIRISLKDVEKQLQDQGLHLPKCHRSYLVNTKRIARVEGNAQGLTLHLDRANLTVPVSRSCVSKFR